MRFKRLGIVTTIRFVAGAQDCREAECNGEEVPTQYPVEGVISYHQRQRLEAAERRVGSAKHPRGAIRPCRQGALP
jgi:hypothetical protein